MAARAFALPQLVRTHPFPPVKIPGRMVWTSSSLGLFRRCKRKWFWKYLMRLRPQYQDKNLMIGRAFHECVAQFYRGRRSDMASIAKAHTDALEKYADENAAYYDQEDYDKLRTAVDNFTGMLVGYAQMYSGDRKEWLVDRKSIECQFKVDYGTFDFAGKCDMIAKKKGKSHVFAVEHKTTSRLRSHYVDRLPLDTQCRGYFTGIIKGLKQPIKQVLYDVVAKSKLRKKANETWEQRADRVADAYMSEPSKHFYRELLPFHQSDVDSFEYELIVTHSEYLNLIRSRQWADPEWLAGVGLMDERLAQLLKTQGGLKDPMSPWAWATNDKVCDEYFRTCEYLPLCTTGLDVGTARIYDRCEDLNEELAEAEDGD